MASFSFGAGNAAKMIRLPLYALGRLGSALIPRSRGRWVFGCAVGIADGALALWNELPSHEGAIWLTTSKEDAQDAAGRGIRTAAVSSWRGYWHTARARVVVVTHGFGDVNRYATAGAFVVQLWHGIPLKRIGLDSPATVQVPEPLRSLPGSGLLCRVIAAAYRSQTRRISLLPAASHLIRGRLESAFSLPDTRVPVTGEPRVDVLSQGTARARRERAAGEITRAVGALPDHDHVILYAPTWRDGDVDPAIPTPEEWAQIDELLHRRRAVLLIRSHPLGAGGYAPRAARVRMMGSDVLRDVTTALSAVDVLITDYSSLIFDVGLVPCAVIPFAPDLDAYVARRGLYGSYDDVAPEGAAVAWTDVLQRLDAMLGSPEILERARRRAQELSRQVHAYDDGRNAARVYAAITARVSLGRRGR